MTVLHAVAAALAFAGGLHMLLTARRMRRARHEQVGVALAAGRSSPGLLEVMGALLLAQSGLALLGSRDGWLGLVVNVLRIAGWSGLIVVLFRLQRLTGAGPQDGPGT